MTRLKPVLQIVLVVLSCAVYLKVLDCDFVGFDDEQYITRNPNLQKGLSQQGIAWAFTTRYASNWHPLTWLSHLLDYELFGMSAKGPHAVNLALHTLSTLLLFQILLSMTSLPWRSFFVSVLFAIHPLHVESVAWIAERKDVLSTFFMMLTLLGYFEFVKGKSRKWYALSLFSFLLGLLSKPMLVTLPFVLLLLDFWPLKRLECFAKKSDKLRISRADTALLLEKVPFFILTLISCVLTLWAQTKSGAVASLASHSIMDRVSNACVAYMMYLVKTIWPANLAAFYPHPGNSLPLWKAGTALVSLLAITFMVIRRSRRFPFLTVGWFWYVGTLIPVIGLVQVGHQAMADRYTYIPLIGIFIIIVWGIAELSSRIAQLRTPVLALAGSITVASLFTVTWFQLDHWKNAITLCQQILRASGDSFVGHNNLGSALLERGQLERAVSHFQKATQIEEGNPDAHFNLGVALYRSAHLQDAYYSFSKALELRADFADAHNQIGMVLADVNRKDEAIQHYRKAIELRPSFSGARNNLAIELASRGQTQEAILQFEEAVRHEPNNVEILNNAGVILRDAGQVEKGMTFLSKALSLQSQNPVTLKNMAQTWVAMGKKEEARNYFNQALQLAPQDAALHYHMGIFFKNNREIQEAISHFSRAVELAPGFAEARSELQRLRHP